MSIKWDELPLVDGVRVFDNIGFDDTIVISEPRLFALSHTSELIKSMDAMLKRANELGAEINYDVATFGDGTSTYSWRFRERMWFSL